MYKALQFLTRSKWSKRISGVITAVAIITMLLMPTATANAVAAVPCSTSGTWTQGEVNVYWLDVEQGDSQLIVGPSGKTLLIDLGETSWNTTGANTKATAIASRIRAICGTGSSPVALDYVMASHHHLDHIGYPSNPNDTTTVGNGLYQLLTPNGLGFTVGTLLDRDGGIWTDANADGDCDVGTSTAPAPETEYHNAGTTSQTAKRWICWLYGPASQADRSIINGHVTRLTNGSAWPAIDLGVGVTATIINANGKDTMQADGITPVSGDHTTQGGSGPPSENDYSVAVKIVYNKWTYATAGDSDGEYNTSVNGYTYNNIEAKLGPLYGNVDTYRANHHGSGHSSGGTFINQLKPESVFISCGSNNYGHPSNRVLTDLRNVVNDRGTGADIYLANNPCDPFQSDGTTATNYTGTFNSNGDVVLKTTGGGTGYTITYDTGSRNYLAYGGPTNTPTPTATNTPTATPTPLPPTATPTRTPTPVPPTATPTATPTTLNHIVISEFRTRGTNGANDEFIELYNPTGAAVNIGGWLIKGSNNAGSVSTRVTITAGTTLQPGKHWLATNSGTNGYSGTVTGNQTYSVGITDDGGIALFNGATIVDQVGMSTGSAYKEGTVLTPMTTNTNQGYERKLGGASASCVDAGNNSTDFKVTAPSAPQNMASATVNCP